jgi:Zn-dependent protease/CBS domain-containing protein
MRGSLRLGRIAGIEIGIHFTWILAFLIITWSLAEVFFKSNFPSWQAYAYWTAGASGAILLFLSVLIHELAHSLVAQARGMSVSSITLFIFGGVSSLKDEPPKAGTEFVMAIAGPATSFILGGIFIGIYFLVRGQQNFIEALMYYLGWTNLALAAFNLLPGFPLDGGRVLRSFLWRTTGDLAKATNISAIVGKILGWLFVIFGVIWMLFTGDYISGIWISIIGIFINSAAESSRQNINLKEQLKGVRVAQVMDVNIETISSKATVAELVRDIFVQRRRRAIPVVDGDRLAGMVVIGDVKRVPQEKWTDTYVEQIMTSNPMRSVRPEDDLNDALQLIVEHDLNQVVVLSQGKLVGLLSRADIINFLQLRKELNIKNANQIK